MSNIKNFTDFYIKHNKHPKFSSNKIVEDDLLEVILQKLEMLLFTPKNEVFGQESDDFGIDIEYYLWETALPKEFFENKIRESISRWIPELDKIGYDLEVNIYDGKIHDILEITFIIKEYNIQFVFL